MVYDAFGNRVSKTVNGVTTQYLVEDDVNPTGYPQVLEEVQNGTAVRTYTYGLQRISESQSIGNVWTTSFYGYDGGGNVRQLTNAAGAVTDTYEYDAFGVGVATSGHTPNEMLYRGEQYDSEFGFYYLRARYYNPQTGMFFSRDPEDGDEATPRTLHKYLYAGGDPINSIDPTGRDLADVVQIGSKIAAAPLVIEGLKIASAAVACAILWEATKAKATVEAGDNGQVEMVAPCVWKASKFPTPEDLANECIAGPIVSEPSRSYPGCTSYEQPFLCVDGSYTVHWISCGGGRIRHKHVRPGLPKGGSRP